VTRKRYSTTGQGADDRVTRLACPRIRAWEAACRRRQAWCPLRACWTRGGDAADASAATPGVFRAHNWVMTAPQPGRSQVLARPAETPAAIRAVLAANAGPEVLASYDADLDAAFVKAREDGDLTVLTATVRRWWFEADAWRDPEAQRAFLARVDRYAAEGPPPPGERMSWQEFRARHSA